MIIIILIKNKGKELEKTEENQFLQEEREKLMLWKLNEVTVVLIVVAALGAVSDMFEKYAKKLNVTIMLEVFQKAANNNIIIAIINFQNSLYLGPKSSALYKNRFQYSRR